MVAAALIERMVTRTRLLFFLLWAREKCTPWSVVALFTATRTESSRMVSSIEVVGGGVLIMSSHSLLGKWPLTKGVGFGFLVVVGVLVDGGAAVAAYDCPCSLVGGGGGFTACTMVVPVRSVWISVVMMSSRVA